MRRCIGCKPTDWKKFRFSSYQDHSGNRGYASPKICLSAAYAWSRIVKHEFILFSQRKLDYRNRGKKYKLPTHWGGEGVCIVMHDGSTCTLGSMLRMYLPDANVRLYNKCNPIEKPYPPYRSYFIVMCEDGISQGNSLYKMREVCERPIDLFLTIGGKKLVDIPNSVQENYNRSIDELVLIHHQLDEGKNVWVKP